MVVLHDPLQLLIMAVGVTLPEDTDLHIQFSDRMDQRFAIEAGVIVVCSSAPLGVVIDWTIEAVTKAVTDKTPFGVARARNLTKAIQDAYIGYWDGPPEVSTPALDRRA